ncbi:MAG: DUF5684 domain-containing protein, partial [Actinobacteria bacterium]|nr:DUF5684 domain-containing protein [Actinomycetota bacterium]
VTYEMARSFKKGLGFTFGLIFLPFIFWPILGFGEARYAGLPGVDCTCGDKDEPTEDITSDEERTDASFKSEDNDNEGEEGDDSDKDDGDSSNEVRQADDDTQKDSN